MSKALLSIGVLEVNFWRKDLNEERDSGSSIHMESRNWAAWPSRPESNMLELYNLKCNVLTNDLCSKHYDVLH